MLLKQAKTCCSLDKARRTYNVLDWVALFLPFVSWLRTYQVKKFLLVSSCCPHPALIGLPYAGACSMHSALG